LPTECFPRSPRIAKTRSISCPLIL